MRIVRPIIIVFGLLLLSSSPEKGWRGIEPLTSTRIDVERLLGRCPKNDRGSCLYKTQNELISVEYSDGPCEKGWPFGYNVPVDTVTGIEVSPLDKTDISSLITSLNLKQDSFEQKVNKDGSLTYINIQRGISVQVFNGKVGSVRYGATFDQDQLHCGDLAIDSKERVEIADPHHRIIKYSDIESDEEREILDRFAKLIRGQPATLGYIIVYAGEQGYEKEAARRLQCQTTYLVRRHGISREQLRTIDGGYRETREVELYMWPKDGPRLLPFPTVRPSRVKTIPDNAQLANILSLCAELP